VVQSILRGKSLTYVLDKIKVQLATYKAFKEGARIIINQGGTRSTKTYSVVKLLIGLALWMKLQISITSLSLPHLKKGALKDWKEVMNNFNLYDQNAHRRTDRAYDYPSGSYIEFFSVDDSLKVRGPGRDVLFVNELNLIDFDTFIQLLLRTRLCVLGDFNPADEFSWIYDELLAEEVYTDGDITWYRRKGKKPTEKPDVAFIKSTYLDNPFLPKEQIDEIDNLSNIDENLARIYKHGERGHSQGVVYTHWKQAYNFPDGNIAYGLDFGYNHPAALVKTIEYDKDLYSEEIIYQSHLTTPELIDLIKQLVPKNLPIYCDTANPDKIEELKRAGIKALPANKDVKEGILFIKSRKWYVKGVNLIKELKSYKYKEINGRVTEEPLKIKDDCCDAARYSCTPFRKPKSTGLNISFHR
jgi:phage terminase large subunit